MTQSSHDDEPLVTFLQQHRPMPPSPSPHLFSHLMGEIQRQSQLARGSHRRWLWLIPGAIAASFLLGGIASLRWSPLSIQTAIQPFSQTEIDPTISDDEVAAFFLDSWSETIHGKAFVAQPTAVEQQWQLMHLNFETTD